MVGRLPGDVRRAVRTRKSPTRPPSPARSIPTTASARWPPWPPPCAPAAAGGYDIEYRIVTPDGTERWIAAAGRAFFDAQDRPRRFIGTVLDITERKRAEQAAERRSEQLQKLAVIAGRLNAAHDVRSVLGILTEEARQLIGARQSVMQADAAVQAEGGTPLTVVSRPDAVPPEGVAGESDGGGALCVPLIGRNGLRLGTIELTSREDRRLQPGRRRAAHPTRADRRRGD